MQGFEDYTFDDKVFKAALYNNRESSARREFDMFDDATLQLLFQDCDGMYHRHPRSGNKFKVYFEIKMSYNKAMFTKYLKSQNRTESSKPLNEASYPLASRTTQSETHAKSIVWAILYRSRDHIQSRVEFSLEVWRLMDRPRAADYAHRASYDAIDSLHHKKANSVLLLDRRASVLS
jgi:hypothetical protein